MKFTKLLLSVLFLLFMVPACGDDVGHDDHDDHNHEGHGHDDHGDDHHGDDHHGHDHDPNEVMTTVNLTFTPASGGEAVLFSWADPEADGSPVIDDITLVAGETYTVAVQILNELEDPAEDVTIELRDELDEHQFFFTGDAVSSPANENDGAIITQSYADEDSRGYPVGLSNTIVANASGMGVMSIMLRHMPPVNETPVKVGGLADLVKDGKTTELPGSVDIEVTFEVKVQ